MKTNKLKTTEKKKKKRYDYNNDSNITLNHSEVKQVVGKRKNKKRYLCRLPCPCPTIESMVFTLFGLHTTASATVAAVY